MDVHIWGVRGSIPAPGPQTARYGGNTPCVSVALDADHTLLLDAGTGLAAMGRALPPGRPHTYFLLVSHPHWDHIHGLTLFAPLMNPDVRFVILAGPDPRVAELVLAQFDGVHFPVTRDDLRAQVSVENGSAGAVLQPFGLDLRHMTVEHAGSCNAFRLVRPDGDLVYMTDNELPAGAPPVDVVRFCQGARYLIHDAQYIDAERDTHSGWGLSFLPDVCRLATEAAVGTLLPFHHDPSRTDDELDALGLQARSLLPERIQLVMAREGHRFRI